MGVLYIICGPINVVFFVANIILNFCRCHPSAGYVPSRTAPIGTAPQIDCCATVPNIIETGEALKSGIPRAVAAVFGEKGAVGLASEVVGMGCLGGNNIHDVFRLAGAAGDDDVALVVHVGDTQAYTVRH